MNEQQNGRTSARCMFVALAASVAMHGQTLLATDPYGHLSDGEKARIFGKRIVSPGAFARSAVTAGLNQWQDEPPEWGQGMAGYGRRYGHKLLNRGVENSIGFMVASPLKQDPRYFRSGKAGFFRRTGHAIEYTFMTRTDSGGRAFSVWRFASNYGSHFVSNAWRPERQRQLDDTLRRGTVSIGNDAASNILKEFWPDIRKRLRRR